TQSYDADLLPTIRGGGNLRYLAPEVETVEVSVEQGFAQSPGDVNYNDVWGDPAFSGGGSNNEFALD
ncbi:MAG: hypothetical protein K2J51_05635, partial [Alistipes sp.]|nr:hypothetical protein [Alistipes sp.]